VVAVTAPVVFVPPAPSAPLQPPDAEQEVALVELHVKVEEPPEAITDGYTDSAAVGRMFTVAVAGALVPPAPVHTSEYTVLALTGPVLELPLAVRLPLHPPEAVHAVALVELQVSVDEPPEATHRCSRGLRLTQPRAPHRAGGAERSRPAARSAPAR
jgi:hypothetical protein